MLENLIQEHFIDQIAAVLREPPKDTFWARDFAAKLNGKTLSPELLRSVADKLVRNGAKSFPGFKVCLSALEEAAMYRGQTSKPAVSRSEAVTRLNYHEKLLAYLKAGGRACKIERAETDLWMQWRTYFNRLGMEKIVALMDEPNRENWTTPGEVPSAFDPDYRAPVHLDYPQLSRFDPSDSEREYVIKGFADLTAKIENRFPDRRRHKMTAREILSMEELVEDFRVSPVALSAEAMALAGITPRQSN